MNTALIVDLNNLVWITRFAQKLDKNKVEEGARELIFTRTIEAINIFYKKYNAQGVILAVDSPNVWRKEIYEDYKKKDMDDMYRDVVKEVITNIVDYCKNNTTILPIKVDKAEGDDIIAVATRTLSEDLKKVIISSDKDFVQLLKNPNTVLFSPTQDKERTSEDPDYDLFVKCIRGDSGDNIYSAFPRVREKRLKEAYEDPVEYNNVMNTVRKDEQLVKDVYDFNRKLIDLNLQPSHLENEIMQALQEQVSSFSQQSAMKQGHEYGGPLMMDKVLSGEVVDCMKGDLFE